MVTISLFITPDIFHCAPSLEVWRDDKPSGTSVTFPRNVTIPRIMEVANDYAAMYRDQNGEPAPIVSRRFLSVDMHTMTATLETQPI